MSHHLLQSVKTTPCKFAESLPADITPPQQFVADANRGTTDHGGGPEVPGWLARWPTMLLLFTAHCQPMFFIRQPYLMTDGLVCRRFVYLKRFI